MTINLVSRGIEIDDELREAIQTGIGSIENRFKGDTTCRITVKQSENNKVKVSVLVYAGKYVFKGEEVNSDKIVALNRAIKEIERNLNKLKTKQLMKRCVPVEVKESVLPDNESDDTEHLADVNEFVVSKKELKVLPMSLDDAYIQMELLGHTFFVFINSDTGLMNILYRKRSSAESYGLIELRR